MCPDCWQSAPSFSFIAATGYTNGASAYYEMVVMAAMMD